MERCMYRTIAESKSPEGLAFMRQFEKEHPEYNFRECFRCVGFLGYTRCDDKLYKKRDYGN